MTGARIWASHHAQIAVGNGMAQDEVALTAGPLRVGPQAQERQPAEAD